MTKTSVLKNNLPVQILLAGFILIIGLLPVHALLSTWAISNFGHPELFKAWKEILLLALLPVALVVMVKNPTIWPKLYGRMINKIILIYFGLNILLGLTSQNGLEATTVGLTYNLRFLVMFLLAQVLVIQLGLKFVETWVNKVLSVVILIVVTIGFLQFLVLPDDFLRHFGYGLDTILPYQTIDQNSDFVRINSTLRGPNPLGLFMTLVLGVVASWWIKRPIWLKGRVWLLGLITLMSVVTLFASQSRSGWLGAFITLLVLAWLSFPSKRKFFILAGTGVLIAGLLVVSIFRYSGFIQNTVFHVNPGESTAINSSEVHCRASGRALEDMVNHPLGQGPGSAGPASFYGDGPKIAENYYLQIGQELGLVGLALMLVIFGLVAVNLLKQRKLIWPIVLLASFIGLNIASLFLHVWAQDEIAMIWWGLAGLYIKTSR